MVVKLAFLPSKFRQSSDKCLFGDKDHRLSGIADVGYNSEILKIAFCYFCGAVVHEENPSVENLIELNTELLGRLKGIINFRRYSMTHKNMKKAGVSAWLSS